MDSIHPTPFPGKRRLAGNPAKKVRDRAKPSTQPAPLTRPKRAFGIARSTNVPTEKPLAKPLPAKTSRPWKPSGNGTQKSSNDISGNGSGKTKVGAKTLKEQAKEADAESIIDNGKSVQDEGVRTPVSSLIKASATGTPYQTAENCSKCRFDKLETSAYWLAQIKIAESAVKHSVSAAFFRLALGCHAQPFRSLQRELKHYVARHNSFSSEILWIDLCKAYGLSNDQFSADPCDLDKLDAVLFEQGDSKPNMQDEANCETPRDECFELDIIDNPMLDISDKEATQHIRANLILTNDDGHTEVLEESVDAKAMPNSSKESGGPMSSEGNVLGRKSCHEKSKAPSSSNSSSNTRIRRSIGSSGKIQEEPNRHEPGLEISGGRPARNIAGAKVSRSVKLRNQGKEEQKVTSPSLKSTT